MNACAPTRDLIDDALDGRLDARARSDFDTHVRQCAACAAEWEFASSVRSSLLKVGFDPAPAGLKESIAAKVRNLDGRKTAPTNYGPPQTGWFRSPAFLRSAAGILVIVAIGWVAMRSTTSNTRSTERAGPVGSKTRDDASQAGLSKESGVAKAKPPAAITVEPAGEVAGGAREADGFAIGGARPAEALDKARAIALGREVPSDALAQKNGATPEQRVRQAETIVWLEANLDALVDWAGDTPALRQLAKDADETLSVFGGGARDGAEKKADEAQAAAPGAPVPSARDDKAEGEVSALKVTDARQAARGAGARRDQGTGEPASYMVTGPGVIARVERVLADRGIASQQVWLKDQDPNLRKRTMEQAATDYRIVDAEVSEAVLRDLVGDLESLDGVRLAPVGGGDRARAVTSETAFAKRPGVDLQAPPGTGGAPGRAEAHAARGTPPESAPAPEGPAAAGPKLLGMRKLRLVLISR